MDENYKYWTKSLEKVNIDIKPHYIYLLPN